MFHVEEIENPQEEVKIWGQGGWQWINWLPSRRRGEAMGRVKGPP